MLRLLMNKKAQTTAEYAILIALVVGAAIAMQTYVKRAWQGNLKDHADALGSQYEPTYLSTEFDTDSNNTINTTTNAGGQVARDIDKSVTRTGSQTINKVGE